MTIKQLLKRTAKQHTSIDVGMLEQTSEFEYTLHTDIAIVGDLYIDANKRLYLSPLHNFVNGVDNALDYLPNGQARDLCMCILNAYYTWSVLK